MTHLFLVSLVRYHRDAYKQRVLLSQERIGAVLDSLNHLSAVPWRINNRVSYRHNSHIIVQPLVMTNSLLAAEDMHKCGFQRAIAKKTG